MGIGRWRVWHWNLQSHPYNYPLFSKSKRKHRWSRSERPTIAQIATDLLQKRSYIQAIQGSYFWTKKENSPDCACKNNKSTLALLIIWEMIGGSRRTHTIDVVVWCGGGTRRQSLFSTMRWKILIGMTFSRRKYRCAKFRSVADAEISTAARVLPVHRGLGTYEWNAV